MFNIITVISKLHLQCELNAPQYKQKQTDTFPDFPDIFYIL